MATCPSSVPSGVVAGDRVPQFDQQPIEVAAMADACWRAHQATGDTRMDPRHRGGGDVVHRRQRRGPARCSTRSPVARTTGCTANGVNLNQGAESTLGAALHDPARPTGSQASCDASNCTTPASLVRPDPSRVIARFFVPGREDLGPGDSRAGGVVDRILALDEAEVEAVVARRRASAAGRVTAALHDTLATARGDGDVARRVPASTCPTLGSGCSARRSPTRTRSRARRSATRRSCSTPTRTRRRRRRLRDQRARHRRGPPFLDRLPHRHVVGRRRASPSTHPAPFPEIGTDARRACTSAPCSSPCSPSTATTTRTSRSSSTVCDDAVRRRSARGADRRCSSPTTPAAATPSRRCSALRELAASGYSAEFSADLASCPSGCCGRTPRRSRTVSRTPASCASSTTTAK